VPGPQANARWGPGAWKCGGNLGLVPMLGRSCPNVVGNALVEGLEGKERNLLISTTGRTSRATLFPRGLATQAEASKATEV
jgi:hypothetical protein